MPGPFNGYEQFFPGLQGGIPAQGSGGSPLGGAIGGGIGGSFGSAFGSWLTNKGNPGGDISLPFFQEDRDRLMALLGQGSPYAGPASQSQGGMVGSDPYRGGWGSLISQLQDQAAGRGPSIADQQYRRASGDAMSQQIALSRGGRSAGAGRQAAQNMGGIQQGLAQGSALARTQEQMGAVGQLGGALSGAGNAAYQRDALQAQLAQQNNQFNASAQNQVSAQNQAAYLNLLAQQLGLSQAQLQALIARAQVNAGAKSPMDQLLSMGSQLGGLGGLMGGGGGGGGGTTPNYAPPGMTPPGGGYA